MHSLTTEEVELLQKAWLVWTQLQEDIQAFVQAQYQATLKWTSTEATYLGKIDAKGVVVDDIEGDGDSGWDATSTLFEWEQLRNLETQHAQNLIVAATIKEAREAEQEKKNQEYRRQQYETLRREFES
jgi:hypothetical protein